MALSNWDTLAVDLEGQPINGLFISPDDVEVSIYKNWIYVQDKKAWRSGGSFDESTIMQIWHGKIDYRNVNIVTIRGPQDGVYIVCWQFSEKKMIGMIGCGVCGYSGAEWVGVQPESVKFLQEWISKSEPLDEEFIQSLAESFDDDCARREHVEELRAERHFVFEDGIAQVKIDKGLRFNQGDAFFAEQMGFKIPATKTGEAKPTIMSQMLESKE